MKIGLVSNIFHRTGKGLVQKIRGSIIVSRAPKGNFVCYVAMSLKMYLLFTLV